MSATRQPDIEEILPNVMILMTGQVSRSHIVVYLCQLWHCMSIIFFSIYHYLYVDLAGDQPRLWWTNFYSGLCTAGGHSHSSDISFGQIIMRL